MKGKEVMDDVDGIDEITRSVLNVFKYLSEISYGMSKPD
jgi:hypothetical protein